MTGIYVLLIELDRPKVVLAGKKRQFNLQQGFYGYVGSALSSLESRVGRHLSSTKNLHWHIDYLLTAAKIRKIICAETGERKECTVAQMLSKRLPWIAGFGCSDCKCQSHLFYCQNLATLEAAVFDVVKNLELDPFVFV
jgi:Uri superfamily endonuclease